jgi:hypothetical protein
MGARDGGRGPRARVRKHDRLGGRGAHGVPVGVPAPVVGGVAPVGRVADAGAAAGGVDGGPHVFLSVADDAGRSDRDDTPGDDDGRRLPFGRLVSDFIAAYGWSAWYCPAVWPTGDGIVPIRVMLAWTADASRRAALSQLRQTEAVSLGAASVIATKDEAFKVREKFRGLQVAAGVRDEPED